MLEWVQEHRLALLWLTGASIVVFAASLVTVPILVARIPANYFAHAHRPPGMWAHRHPALRMTLLIAKNVFGWVLIVVGVAMLVLPGQGLLTVLIGFLLLDFPGKYRLEKWLVSRKSIARPINWLRGRTGHAPLSVGEERAS